MIIELSYDELAEIVSVMTPAMIDSRIKISDTYDNVYNRLHRAYNDERKRIARNNPNKPDHFFKKGRIVNRDRAQLD